jgi:hypothetical protein
MNDTDDESPEITPEDVLALEQQFREQEVILNGMRAVPGVDAASLDIAEAALNRQRRLLRHHSALRDQVAERDQAASKLALLYEESQLANKELRELLAAFVESARKLVMIPRGAVEPVDELRPVLEKFERSGLVL